MINNSHSVSLDTQRKLLPIHSGRRLLMMNIRKNETCIITGETGCGKTTQVPQYVYEDGLSGKGVIGITQPRRVAATTLATRVSQEAKSPLGKLVGYSIRFEDVTSGDTKIKFLTDGMLLREAVLDEKLSAYSVIILDEAHERTINTDVLLGIVKKAQARRKRERLWQLKIIIMSASMDVDHFRNFFNGAPVLYIEGREHDVQIMHAKEPQEDYAFSCLTVLFQIHREAPAKEGVLVFLTGQEEIESMIQSIRLLEKELSNSYPPMDIFPLYSALTSSQIEQAFKLTVEGHRKVVVSTNVAETSVTIPDIKYVIDSGKVKSKVYNPNSGLDSLKVQQISQAQAWQRTGRAGRECPGVCYREYTQAEFAGMPRHPQPEILRCNLSTVALQLLALKINISNFDFIDKPPKEAINAALQELKNLGAIDSIEYPSLTPLGQKMVKFPLDPRYSKMIISSKDFGCGEDILTIVALLSGESIFVSSLSKRNAARNAHEKFASSEGDHITLLQVFRNYRNVPQESNWCHINFLNIRNLRYAVNVRKQLGDICRSLGIALTSCGSDYERVRRCLITGLFMNIAELQREKQFFTVAARQKVALHPSSVLAGTLPPYVLFSELVQTSKSYVRTVSIVDPDWLTELMPEYFRKHRLSTTSRLMKCMEKALAMQWLQWLLAGAGKRCDLAKLGYNIPA